LKVQLDTELQAYHKLLEGEESRLKIEPVTTPLIGGPVDSSRRGSKRRLGEDQWGQSGAKLMKIDSKTFSSVMIESVDPEGMFVRLKNCSEDTVPIGGWTIKNMGQHKEVIFKFNARQTIGVGKAITVWSNSSGHEHAPPTHIVMKNQAWPYREHVRVELLKGDDTMAYYELVATDGGEEESFNFTGDGNRCNIV